MMIVSDALARLLFPPKCVLCGTLLDDDETDLCRSCRLDSPDCPVSKNKLPFLDSWTAVWYYEGNVRRSILRFKFHGARSHAGCYGRLLAMKLLREYPQGFDVLTWVPISGIRKFRRGYDQVELLAQAVGAELGLQPTPLLKKRRHNRPQSGISGDAQRRANVLGAYRILDPEAVSGKSVLLLDDILTTGATAGDCARMLLTAGAREVHCGAVAMARRGSKSSR